MRSRRELLAAGCLVLVSGSGCTRIRDAVADISDETETTTEPDADGDKPDADGEFRITVVDDNTEVELVTEDDVATVGEIQQIRPDGSYLVPVTLTDAGTEAFADGLERVGAFEDRESHPIRTYFEGELLYEATLSSDLADVIESSEWTGEFVMTTGDREEAERLKEALEES